MKRRSTPEQMAELRARIKGWLRAHKQPTMRVSKITVGRLYNLGNYEHVRYELEVEIPPGASAKEALRRVMFVLKAANPKPPCSESEIHHAEAILKDPQAWHKNVADKKERRRLIRELVKGAKNTLSVKATWEGRRNRGLELLDRFGATTVFKDCKRDWQDDYDPYE